MTPTDHHKVPVDRADETEADETHRQGPDSARGAPQTNERRGEASAPGRADPARGEAERTPQQGPRAQDQQAQTRTGQAQTRTGQAQARTGQAQARTGQAQRGAGSMRADTLRLSDLEAAQVESLQTTLQDHGFYDGPIDGQAGPQTRIALREYYSALANLASTGHVFADGAEPLGLDANEIERVKGRGEPQREPMSGRQQPDTASPDTDDTKSDALDTTTDGHGMDEGTDPGSLDTGNTEEPLEDAPVESTFDATELH